MPELKDYEYPCPHCNGLKYVGPFRNVCGKCMGSGKLDWIENVVGKNYSENIMGKNYNEFLKRIKKE